MRTTTLGIVAVGLGLAATLNCLAQFEVTFTDTFNTAAEAADINAETGSPRQSGPASPLEYTSVNPTGDQIWVNLAGAEDKLTLIAADNTAYVSPNRNFTAGGQFKIQFKVNPGIDDPDNASSDWCAVVFGATRQNVFVNDASGGGFGILFRNNGGLQIFDGGTAIGSGEGGIPGGIPRGEFQVRIEVETADFSGSPAVIRLFINDQAFNLTGGEDPAYTKASGFFGNYVTLEGYAGAGVAWTHTFDDLQIEAVPCARLDPPVLTAARGEPGPSVTVRVPASFATTGGQVVLTSDQPGVAIPAGADAAGALTLNFAAGGPTEQIVSIQPVSAGTAILTMSSPQGLCAINTAQVNVAAGPGFEEVVLRDPFLSSGFSTDVSDQVATRQTGTARGQTYAERPEHMLGEAADEFTYQENGRLYLQVDATTWVSPNYNFIDGPSFTLEVDVDATSTNPDRTSDDWAAVVFGATSQGVSVNTSDGMGILFRNNGGYQVFDGSTAIFSSAAEDSLPAGDLRLRVEVAAGNYAGTGPATVAFFVNDQPLKITSGGGNTYARSGGFRGNYLTLVGYASAGNFWIYSFDNLSVSAEACATFQPASVAMHIADTPPTIAVKLPQAFVPEGGNAVVTVRSVNPGIAVPQGASATGDLVLTFTRAQLIQTFELDIRGSGRAQFTIDTDEPVCVGEPLEVIIRGSLVRNPSFEADPHPGGVGYGTVSEWAGVSGLNRFDVSGGGPFNDNGAYPDRDQIAFKQGNGVVSQVISGLEPGKEYWVQVRYNRRDCCGGSSQTLTARFDGVELEAIAGIQAVGGANPYSSRSWTITAAAAEGLLEIESGGEGDHTLLLDAITVVQRDAGNVTVINPSFEASGFVPGDGVVSPRSLSGWIGDGTYGVNLNGGRYADNGLTADQDNVAFVSGVGSLSQDLLGLIAGRTYMVSVAVNAQSGTLPRLRVTAGETVVLDEEVSPVGGSASYAVKTGSFVAAGGSARLTLAQTKEGNHTLLLDDVRVVGESVNIPPIESTPDSIELAVGQTGGTITVTVPGILIQDTSATVTVTSLDPAIAVPAGGSGGSLTLTFAAGGETSQSFQVQGVARGNTSLRFSNPQNAPFKTPEINVAVITSFIRNPSFESNFHPTFPGYGPIAAWDSEGPGNTGVNNNTGPFHDNGAIPDRGQVALLQVEKTIRQEIVGLAAGQNYWLQFFYNTRNCCGGSIDVAVRFDGVDLDYLAALTPVGGDNPYNLAHLNFVPASSSGLLEFATAVSGDATALLDAVTIVRRDANEIVVINPSFEASGRVGFPGYIQPQTIAGWTGFGGGRGVNVNGVGPFADNGVNPDQDSVLFLQGAATGVRQTIGGLSVGTSYIVSVAANARSGNSPRLKLSADGVVLLEQGISPVGGTAAYPRVEASFVAASDSAEIAFEQTAEGDQTVLLDDVRLRPGTVTPRPSLQVTRAPNGIRLTWSSAATGFVLQTSGVATGGWVDSGLPVTTEGQSFAVVDVAGDAAKFYRLIRR